MFTRLALIWLSGICICGSSTVQAYFHWEEYIAEVHTVIEISTIASTRNITRDVQHKTK